MTATTTKNALDDGQVDEGKSTNPTPNKTQEKKDMTIIPETTDNLNHTEVKKALDKLREGSRTEQPCPDWCGFEPGHPWEFVAAGDDRLAVRFHEQRISDAETYIAVTAEETAPAARCCPEPDGAGCDHPIGADGPSTIALRQTVIALARATVRDLFAKYEIADRDQAKRLVRERFSAEDLATYEAAIAVLDGSGVLG